MQRAVADAQLHRHQPAVRRRDPVQLLRPERVAIEGDCALRALNDDVRSDGHAKTVDAAPAARQPRSMRRAPRECDLVDGKLAGLAVVVGSRVAAHADVGEVLVSGTVKDLVARSGIGFEARGMRELKGVGEWPVYAVADP